MVPETPSRPSIKPVVFRLFSSGVYLALLEVVSYFGCAALTRYALFFVPRDAEGYAEYLAKRDPVLGWPSPGEFGKGEYDSIGSRIVPSHPDPNARPACVSVFGDSFTFGTEGTASYTACSRGHLNPEGNAILAKLVARRLMAMARGPISSELRDSEPSRVDSEIGRRPASVPLRKPSSRPVE